MIDTSDVDALLAQAEDDRRQGHDRVEAEHADTVAAIKRVAELLRRRNVLRAVIDAALEPSPEPQPQNPSAPVVADNGGHLHWPGLRAFIRECIDRRPDAFTLDDVMNDLQEYYPHQVDIKRVAVSGELWRMNKNGSIRIAQAGSGNKPHTYAKGLTTNMEE